MCAARSSFISRWFSSTPAVDRSALFLDLAIIGALAEGEADDRGLDALAAAIARHPELSDYDWPHALRRARQLLKDAPLFADTRHRLKRALSDPEDRKLGFELAASVAASARELGGDARAVLHSVGASLGLGSRTRRRLMEPFELATLPPAYRWENTRYCDPERRPQNLFEAIAEATPELDLPLLLYRLGASFRLLQFELGGYKLKALGPLVQLRRGCLRLDAHYTSGGRQVWARFFGPRESLHPSERALWTELLAGVEPPGQLIIVHSQSLSPRDLDFFSKQEDPRLSMIRHD